MGRPGESEGWPPPWALASLELREQAPSSADTQALEQRKGCGERTPVPPWWGVPAQGAVEGQAGLEGWAGGHQAWRKSPAGQSPWMRQTGQAWGTVGQEVQSPPQGQGTAKAEGVGEGQGNPESVDLERVAEQGERRLGSGTGPAASGSHVAHGQQVVPGAAGLGPSSQQARALSRRHDPVGTGAHAAARCESTALTQPAGPGSPSAGCGCVSPGTRAAGAGHLPCLCASACCAGQPPGFSVSSSAASDNLVGQAPSAAHLSRRGAWLRQRSEAHTDPGCPSAAVTSQCPLGTQGSGSSLNPW